MKATQDNAEWVSNTYKQGTSEDNWAAVSAKYRVPRNVLMPATTSTTSATVLSTTDGITAGDSLFLYNSTDGYVDYTVSGLTLEAAGSTPPNLSQSSYINEHTLFDGTDEKLKCWNNDGTRCFTYNTTGGVVKEYTAPRPWDIRGSSNEGCTAVTAHNLDYTGYTLRATSGTTCVFSTGGEYFFMMDTFSHYICRWKLSTLYDLSTAGSVTVYDVGVDSSSKWVSTLRNFDTTATTSELSEGGFGGLGFSEDGKKGFLFRCDNVQGSQNMDHNTIWSFELATPFDFDSVSAAKYGEMGFSPSTSWTNLHAVFSPDGKVIYSVRSTTSNLRPEKRILATAWDAESTYSNVGYNISSYYARVDYYYGNCITMASDGSIFSVENDRRWFYNEAAETDVAWNRTTFNTTSASLTTAPTLLGTQGQNISDIKYVALTRADADQDGTPLAISSSSTSTSLSVFPPMDYQGSTALNNKKVSVDGLELSLGTPTFSDNQINVVSTETSAQSVTNRAGGVHSHATYEQLVNLDDPATRAPGAANSWSQSCGIDFDNTGTRFFYSGYAQSGSVNFGADIGTAVVRPIVEYSLTTPWDLSTATRFRAFDGEDHFKTGAPNANAVSYYANDFQFNADGTKFYTLNLDSSPRVSWMWEYDLSKPFDLTTISFVRETYLNPFISNQDDIYSFAISDDGKFMKLYYSSGAADLTSTTYLQASVLSFGTPYDTSTLSFVRTLGSRQYKQSFTGDSTYGYVGYGAEYPNNSAPRYNVYYVSTLSGNGTNMVNSSDVLDMSQMEGFTDGMWGNTMIGKTIVVDGGTKMYIHLPELHSVAMFTGPFGNFRDMYTVDSTSLSLSDQPRQVEFTVPASFTSMGSTSLSSNTNLYKEYATPEVSIDAEALKFKIEGDTGAEVSRFNADLFT